MFTLYHWFEEQKDFLDWCFECLSLDLERMFLWGKFIFSKWWIFHFNFYLFSTYFYVFFFVFKYSDVTNTIYRLILVTNRFYSVVYDDNIWVTCTIYLHFFFSLSIYGLSLLAQITCISDEVCFIHCHVQCS